MPSMLRVAGSLMLLGAWCPVVAAQDMIPPAVLNDAAPAPVAGPGVGSGPYWAPGGTLQQGMRVGSPYYWSPSQRGAWGSGAAGWDAQPWSGAGAPAAAGPYAGYGPGYAGSPGSAGFVAGYGAAGVGGFGSVGWGAAGGGWTALPYGGGQVGPWAYTGAYNGSPYDYHFGPGFHRHSDQAHYRFPYYSYRRPWYYPGHASYNRDTNFPW